MKCIVLSENLRRAVALTEKASGKSISLPILSYLLLEVEKNRIKLTGTNLDIAVSAFVSGKIEESGAIAIPSKIFTPFVQQLTEEKVVLETFDETKLSIKSSEFKSSIQGSRPDEFPIIPKVKQEMPFTVDSALLKTALDQVTVATGTSETQSHYASILVHYDSNDRILKFVATDSHRLAEKSILSEEFHTEISEEVRALLSSRAAQELLRILQTVSGETALLIDQNQISVRWSDIEFYSRLQEGDFPEYSGIVPKAFAANVRISKKRMLETLRRGGLFSSRIQDMRLEISPQGGKIIFRSQDPSVGEYHAELAARAEGKAMVVAFNWKLLYEGIEKISGNEVFMGFQSEMAPALVRSEDDPSYFYVLAPLRL